jgi:catechol 2,3-dioxygenase-like lactoylglutathione lyase family enzyme
MRPFSRITPRQNVRVATIDHVTIRVRDLGAALQFYERCFELLSFAGERTDAEHFHEWGDFSISDRGDQTSGLHVGFAAQSPEHAEAWWEAMTAAGAEDDGRPGPRPEYGSTYYGAFVRDLDGNSVEAVHHETTNPETGAIDHLWIRVRDLAPAKRFYEAVAAATGAEARDRGERLQVVTGSGTFSLLEGPPARNVHLALGVSDEPTVEAFHRAALAAGGRDNGAPGLRPEYSAGYYGAFVLDPDGNNIVAVHHA